MNFDEILSVLLVKLCTSYPRARLSNVSLVPRTLCPSVVMTLHTWQCVEEMDQRGVGGLDMTKVRLMYNLILHSYLIKGSCPAVVSKINKTDLEASV